MPELLWLIASGLVVQSLPSGGDRSWYDTLNKPGITPPSWLFGVVWPILCAMMAVAAVLVFRARSGGADVRGALIAFGIQLALNLAWSPIFFGLQQIGWALGIILVLWILIVVTAVLFFRASTVAGVLMVPYLLWVSFASVLTSLLRKRALAQHRASHVDSLTPAPERGGLGRGSSHTSALVPSPPAARPASRAGRPGERKVRSVRRGAPSPNPLPRSGAGGKRRTAVRTGQFRGFWVPGNRHVDCSGK